MERFQVNALKRTAHFNFSFMQVCDFEVPAAGKAVHDFNRLDGVSNGCKNPHVIPKAVRTGCPEKGFM